MRATNKRLTILSENERIALYALPDFDEDQRNTYLILTVSEQELMHQMQSFSSKVYCALQIGYFKAKQLFFNFSWDQTPEEDIQFVISQYFTKTSDLEDIGHHEYYTQRRLILDLFNYQPWSSEQGNHLLKALASIVKRDITLPFILSETLAWLQKNRIIRPGYSACQDIISSAIQSEQKRLNQLISLHLEDQEKTQLTQLLATDSALSELAALKQDAKDFKYRVMQNELNKIETLKPLYLIAKKILPFLAISQQNINYYASLAHYYTVYELRNLQSEQTCLYLLCYAEKRYQQLIDNTTEAFCYQIRQFDDFIKTSVRSFE